MTDQERFERDRYTGQGSFSLRQPITNQVAEIFKGKPSELTEPEKPSTNEAVNALAAAIVQLPPEARLKALEDAISDLKKQVETSLIQETKPDVIEAKPVAYLTKEVEQIVPVTFKLYFYGKTIYTQHRAVHDWGSIPKSDTVQSAYRRLSEMYFPFNKSDPQDVNLLRQWTEKAGRLPLIGVLRNDANIEIGKWFMSRDADKEDLKKFSGDLETVPFLELIDRATNPETHLFIINNKVIVITTFTYLEGLGHPDERRVTSSFIVRESSLEDAKNSLEKNGCFIALPTNGPFIPSDNFQTGQLSGSNQVTICPRPEQLFKRPKPATNMRVLSGWLSNQENNKQACMLQGSEALSSLEQRMMIDELLRELLLSQNPIKSDLFISSRQTGQLITLKRIVSATSGEQIDLNELKSIHLQTPSFAGKREDDLKSEAYSASFNV